MAGYLKGLQGYLFEGELVNGESQPIANGAFVYPYVDNGTLVMKLVSDDSGLELLCKEQTILYDNKPAYRFIVTSAPDAVYFVENGFEVSGLQAYDTTEYATAPGKQLRAHRLVVGDEIITDAIEGELVVGDTYGILDGGIAGTGSIEIVSVIKDDGAVVEDSEDDHAFTITLDDTSISGTYGDATFASGIATLTISGNGSKTISGLTVGIGYEVQIDDVAETETGTVSGTATVATFESAPAPANNNNG